jgi:CRISPR system Cascade subunit CasB
MEKFEKNKAQAFVQYVLSRMNGKEGDKPDTRFAAALRRVDNPDTEYQGWEYLATWCDLSQDGERLPLETIAAAIAREKPAIDGTMSIGQALAFCYREEGKNNGNEKDAAKAKLRRLLACSTPLEACLVLRSLLKLIASRGGSLCYSRLLDELLPGRSFERVKTRWAQDFYGQKEEA